MDFIAAHRLTLILFLPGLAGALLLFLPDRRWPWARGAAVAVALADLALGALLLRGFDPGAGFQLVEKAAWIPRFDVSYHLGVDGLGLVMVLLTLVLTPLALLAPGDMQPRFRSAFYATLLLLETALLGVFMSLDLVLFYIFWEAMLVPAYFLLGLWGGERRIRAAVKFILYTLAGSVLMLVGILLLYRNHQTITGYGTFSLPSLIGLAVPQPLQGWLFLLFFLAFAVKTPLFPFHGWLPDAYQEAPTGGSLLMAGVLAKMGTYGFLRFCLPLFPDAVKRYAPAVVVLALAGVLYGAFLALAQEDLKRLVAWSSFSHMNFIVLGIFVLNQSGATGAVTQMVSHGLVTGALFLLAGMLSAATGRRGITALGGLSGLAPRAAAALVFFVLAASGLPGLSSFIGEFLMVSGAFRYAPGAGIAAILGVALGAYYFLRLLGRTVFAGDAGGTNPAPRADVDGTSLALLLPLAAAVVLLGLFPGPLIRLVSPILQAILKRAGVM